MLVEAFKEIMCVDCEFVADPGERQRPVCLVFKQLRAGRSIRLWQDELPPEPPFPVDASTLFVAYYASAELGCFRTLGWPMPARILDLFVEFRNHTNGLPTIAGNGLIGALAHFGLDTIGATEKAEMRAMFMRGGPWSDAERSAGLDYCEGDVLALERLLGAMLPHIDLPRALLRGRYMATASARPVIGERLAEIEARLAEG
jgi:DNA polymerase I